MPASARARTQIKRALNRGRPPQTSAKRNERTTQGQRPVSRGAAQVSASFIQGSEDPGSRFLWKAGQNLTLRASIKCINGRPAAQFYFCMGFQSWVHLPGLDDRERLLF